MPTKNPRLSVVLTPSIAALLSELSEVTGESSSSLVRDLLVQSEQPLARVLALVKAAKAAKGQVGEGLSNTMQRYLADIEDARDLALARSDRVTRDLVAQAEAEAVDKRRAGHGRGSVGGAPVPGSDGVNPRASNRGVRSPRKGTKAAPKRSPRGRV